MIHFLAAERLYLAETGMLYRLASASLAGIEAQLVEVEADIAAGLPSFVTVGLPDAAVRESKERVRSALRNCGYDPPPRRITVNLAPADRRKEGSAFDLPIALGILAEMDVFPAERLAGFIFVGELALDGGLKPGRGALPVALLARETGVPAVVLPGANAREAALVPGVDVYGLRSLVDVVLLLRGEETVPPRRFDPAAFSAPAVYACDFKEIKGQHQAKRALEVAAAGAHNVLLVGPPGAGKTMLARRLPTILPPMTFEEGIEVARIYSAAGLLRGAAAVNRRPFRSPHHTASDAGMIGGGSLPRPGEVSLAHRGVLFMDEFPEFRRKVLEDLRQPLEDGEVTVCRTAMTVVFPAAFMLVAAMNPCADVFGGAGRGGPTEAETRRYYARLSGPLLDRIDIQVEVPAVKFREIVSRGEGESSASVRERVVKAREWQLARFRGRAIYANAQMGPRDVRRFCAIDGEGERLLEAAMTRLGLSARAYDRILKVSRTIADLAGQEDIRPAHLGEAIQYRMMDRIR